MAFDYDAIVVGTGFGGCVAAVELAVNQRQRVLLLERGVWWYSPENLLPPWIRAHQDQPVQFWPRPNHTEGLIHLLSVVQSNSPLEKTRRIFDVVGEALGRAHPQPLYRYSMFPDVHVVTASGVGGGSLVYGDVTMAPRLDDVTSTYPVLADWPVPALTTGDYQSARSWMETHRGKLSQVVSKFPLPGRGPLDPNNPADDPLLLRKSRALHHAVHQLGGPWKDKRVRLSTADDGTAEYWAPLDLSITEYAGKPQFCERQGRCIIGCLPGARHSLNKTIVNWLLDPPPPAPKPDVRLASMTEVHSIAALPGGGYQVNYRDLRQAEGRLDPAEVPLQPVTAPVVVLAAGTLGTTELLLRSRQGGLQTSDALGSRFSSNGDFSGFAVFPAEPGLNPLSPVFPTRGPTNTSHVMFADGKLQLTVEDGGIPAMFASVGAAGLQVLANAVHREPLLKALLGGWIHGHHRDLSDAVAALGHGTEDEKLANVFWFNALGTDNGNGRFDLDDDGNLSLGYNYPALAMHPIFAKLDEVMRAMTAAMGADYVPFPLWEGLADRKLITIFPLGGCPMGPSSTDGVVDATGRVYDTARGHTSTHPGLHITDASVIPGPLAVQPTLTIVALALKAAAAMRVPSSTGAQSNVEQQQG